MRKSRKRNCKKLKLKHIPDFFDDIEEIVYTYRESLHGDISVEYIYCLTFNDGNPLATFEGTRPMDNPDFEKRVYDQVCQQKVSVSVNAWYGLLYRLFMSPTSYQAALSRDIYEREVVSETGLEPVRDFHRTGF